jgi:glycine/D-amino acid oxidase-like deaminating enzyme/nitrite reductase/ring-hydroxylating ferredoxin subunit
MHAPLETRSLWLGVLPRPFPVLSPPAECHADVAIIGGGIAGLSAAYELSQSGRRVVVLEAGTLASGQTERTTAHLSWALDDRFHRLIELHGRDKTRGAGESHKAAIQRIEEIVQRESIECEFQRVDGYLFADPQAKPDILDLEFQALQDLGFLEVEMLARAPVSSFHTGPCLRFPNQAQMNPLRYLLGLVSAIQAQGGQIFTHAFVERIEKGPLLKLHLRGAGTVTAHRLIVATNSPINDRFVLHTKQAAYRTYAIGARIPRDSVPPLLLWDTLDSYHYVRTLRDETGDYLIVGGEDHKTGQDTHPSQHFTRLESWMRTRFPMTSDLTWRWSGQVLEPVDGLAFIGRNPFDSSDVYVATGDSGHGMTHGVIAGMLLTDLITGRRNFWEDIYDPSRISLRSFPHFAKENLNVAAQYGHWMNFSGEARSEDEILRGTGRIVKHGLKAVATYRNEDGQLVRCSAMCPHLGGLVSWNEVERSWDCPCHGSRFDATGKVLNGPARTNLAPYQEGGSLAGKDSQEASSTGSRGEVPSL